MPHYLELVDKKMNGIINIAKNVGTNVYDNLYDELAKIKDNEDIYFNIETNGGTLFTLQKVIRIMQKIPNKKIAVIRKSAHSAGTILALACDEIQFSENATLSAIDPQHPTGIDIKNLKIVNFRIIPELYEDGDHEKNIVKYYSKVISHYRNKIKLLINNKYSDETKENILKHMYDTPLNHEELFFKENLEEIGLDIKNIDEKLEKNVRKTNKKCTKKFIILGFVSLLAVGAIFYKFY
jgi:hypothetical protein